MSAERVRSEAAIHAYAGAGLALLVLAVLGDVLLAPGNAVLSSDVGDAAYYFARIRRFAAAEIWNGNLPLWNPHIFAGVPLLGGFQAGMLYPPNVVYLILPLAKAIDLDIAFHLFVTGFGAFAWVRHRGVHAAAAFLAGVIAMLCGATTLRMFAGQLSLLAANAWSPLLLLVVERLIERPSLGWCLVGIAAASLQILAGYPFATFAIGLVGGVYALTRVRHWQAPGRVLAALASVAAVPLLITAAQLLTGLQTSWETTRAGGVSYEFAATYSLRPENLITALVPGFFGDIANVSYWGRWWFWDNSVFVGATAIALAAVGVRHGAPRQRRFALAFAVGLLLIALGDSTPVFYVLHRFVPGFDSFRAPSKFVFHASLFVALLAAIGLDRMLRETLDTRRLALVAAAGAVGLPLAGLLLRVEAAAQPGGGQWGELVDAIEPWLYTETFARETASFVEGALRERGLFCAVLAVALALAPRRRGFVWLVAVLCGLELLVFARAYRGGFDLRDLERPELEAFYRKHPGDHRFFTYARRDRTNDNYAIDAGVSSLWGYDPVQLARYSRFLEFAREEHTDFETPHVANQPDVIHPIFRLLRCRYSQPLLGPTELPDALPHFLLLHDYRVLETDDVLPALLDPDFDPTRTVLLESPPEPAPLPDGRPGRVSLVAESTDHLLVDVTLPDAAILLVTDVYAEGWRAVSVGEAAPAEYAVLPADYIVRAVPLPAGQHRLRIEYAPSAFRIGRFVSGVSTAGFGTVVVAYGIGRVRRRR